MTLPIAPGDAAKQLQWLLDRAALSDLLNEYARCVDDKDWEGFAALFTATGALEVAGVRLDGDRLIAAGEIIADYDRTHHVSTNHAIHITGDRATAHARVIAIHVRDGQAPSVHGDMGGEYTCSMERTRDGWRFTEVRGRTVWTNGSDLPGRC